MQNHTDELTFSQIFHLLKKSLKRAMLYVLASVIFVTATLFLVRSLLAFNTSSSVISLTEKSTVTLDELNRNKATAVQKAVNGLALSDQSDIENKILQGLSINAIVPSGVDISNQEITFVPTAFTLTLNGKQLANLTAEQQSSLLDEITRELIIAQGVSKLPALETTTSLNSELEVLEYFQIAETLYAQAQNAYQTIYNQIENRESIGDYVHPEKGCSFKDLLTKLSTLYSKIDGLKNYVIANRIENVNGLEDFFSLKKQAYQLEKNNYETMLTQALEIINKYPSGTGSTQNNATVVVDGSAYESLAKDYYQLLDRQRTASQSFMQYEEYLNVILTKPINTDQAKKQYVETELINIFFDLKTVISDYRILAENYNANFLPTSEIVISCPARSYSSNPISISTIIFALIVVAIIAWVIALCQANAKSEQSLSAQPNEPASQPTNE